ncbi:hypothetical protein, variant [Aphanomyces invadans]|uniref:ubiquitinyl hydrolase 1 n=1 Tax=Aphanomyces invadans TaxID=157072 RepID=A0A024UDB1_9STRA|nr:hypothetical protein, variant [Aphanomyces invadans]ETW04259.1 hypothetical protein, variant [Aphanomyces invadans]|eukprot:XP_008867215.1 hypothetical protein, variant [Aphanomyces invadans]
MTDAATLGDSSNIYHEKQFLMRCGLHSVNNMLQRRAFSANEFDAIAETLAQTTDSTWGFSPYRAVLGIGNFGVDVLTTALLRYGHRTTYFDRRKSLDSIDLSSVKGLLCNISSSRMLGLWQTRHWFTIRQIDRVYYNLDSKLPAPVPFADAAAVLHFLQSLPPSDTTILLVAETSPQESSKMIQHSENLYNA